jgi:hypothetical protein
MIPHRALKKAIAWVRSRIERSKLYCALLELRHIDQARETARRQHRPYKHFDKAREALITASLRRGG